MEVLLKSGELLLVGKKFCVTLWSYDWLLKQIQFYDGLLSSICRDKQYVMLDQMMQLGKANEMHFILLTGPSKSCQ